MRSGVLTGQGYGVKGVIPEFYVKISHQTLLAGVETVQLLWKNNLAVPQKVREH